MEKTIRKIKLVDSKIRIEDGSFDNPKKLTAEVSIWLDIDGCWFFAFSFGLRYRGPEHGLYP